MTETTKETLSITVDGRTIEAIPGEMIIAAAERAGTYIPRFCYHPRMKPVGMCRMCLVEVNGPRGPQLIPSCYVPVAEGQEVITNSARVKKAQDGVLEFLLVNHPLDCPVCDKGGECPLQDQTFAYGPGESRFVEEKRHWEKPIALSDLVLLDRERCIQCSRCTRFADEIAGDPLIEFINRGEQTEVNVFPDEPFASYFSGNTVQICPVGALTSEPYRFKARPWDLEQVESTCTTCAVGCAMNVQSSTNSLVRYLGVDSDPVNQGWLCDKGRYNYDNVNSDQRLTNPQIKSGNEWVDISWSESLTHLANTINEAVELRGANSVAVIGGSRLPNEDIYQWVKLTKGLIGTDNVYSQYSDGLPAEVVLGLPQATIDDACAASQVVLLSPDIKEELPVLYLRLRQAVIDRKIELVEVSAVSTGLTKYAKHHVTYMPGESPAAVQKLIDDGIIRDDAVVLIGRPSLAEHSRTLVKSISLLAALGNTRFLPVLRRANVRGTLELGMSPGLLPGRMELGNVPSALADAWPTMPEQVGGISREILEAGIRGEVSVLILLGADLVRDFPDAELVTTALQTIPTVVCIQAHPTPTRELATLVLPSTTFGETSGTTTNIEGRVTRLATKVTAPGNAWPDFVIATELAFALNEDVAKNYFATTLEGVQEEMARVIPSWSHITSESLQTHRDGLLVNAVRASDAPPALTFSATVDSVSVPRRDQYSLRLISSRTLYDEGTSVVMSPSLARLAQPLMLHVNASDLAGMSASSGDNVSIHRQGGQRLTVTLVVDNAIPKGCAWIPYAASNDDVGTNVLLHCNAVVNDIFLETQS